MEWKITVQVKSFTRFSFLILSEIPSQNNIGILSKIYVCKEFIENNECQSFVILNLVPEMGNWRDSGCRVFRSIAI